MAIENTTLLDQHFKPFGETALDGKKRITITKAIEVLRNTFKQDPAKMHFAVHVNRAGQILLSPETTIPLHEAWLYKNRVALQSVLQGLEEAGRGELVDAGSFVQYADDEIE